ncbi:MAG: TetR/AcrR family transcriptional regulator [Betaproteobacteria bacterium]|nr:TetR/AcrR family transcriptional regulator [Betaproteobacteria bacterium]
MIERLARVFRSAGFDRATLTALSRESGLQRASLYHLFPGGKAEMAKAVIDHSNIAFASAVLSTLEGSPPPRQRFGDMVESINRYYKSGREACLLGSFALEMPSDEFGAAIRAGFLRWIELLSRVFLEAGLPAGECHIRAREVVAMLQGALVVSRGIESNPCS